MVKKWNYKIILQQNTGQVTLEVVVLRHEFDELQDTSNSQYAENLDNPD